MTKQEKAKPSSPPAKKRNNSEQSSHLPKISKLTVAILLIALLLIALFTNIFPFVWNTIRCGQLPVESTDSAASYSYKLPGDKGYGPHIFSNYTYCTEAEIEATNGYQRNVFTEAGKEE